MIDVLSVYALIAQTKHIASLHVVVLPGQTMGGFMEVVKHLREVRKAVIEGLPLQKLMSDIYCLKPFYSAFTPGACTEVSRFSQSSQDTAGLGALLQR